MVDEYIREHTRSTHTETHTERAKKHSDYIFDLGEHPVRSENKQRFRDAYPTSRPEYSDHAFNVKIDGKERKIRVPTKYDAALSLYVDSQQWRRETRKNKAVCYPISALRKRL